MRNPVILLAPGRCFSSLTCAMLGQHPALYALPETQLLARDSVAEWLEDFGDGVHSHGLLRAVAEIVFGAQSDENVIAARHWLTRRCHVSTAEILEELADELAPLILVEKTPMVTYRPEHMRRAINAFPRARFLYLTRHPCGYGRSLLEFFQQRAPRQRARALARIADPESIFHGLLDPAVHSADPDPQYCWLLRNNDVLQFTGTLPREQTCCVRSEDLLANTHTALRQICQWLNLADDPNAINDMLHPEYSPFAAFGPSLARLGGDPKFLASPRLRRRTESLPSLDSPMPWSASRAAYSPEVRALAARLGYS